MRVERQACLDRIIQRPDEGRDSVRKRVQVDRHAARARAEAAQVEVAELACLTGDEPDFGAGAVET